MFDTSEPALDEPMVNEPVLDEPALDEEPCPEPALEPEVVTVATVASEVLTLDFSQPVDAVRERMQAIENEAERLAVAVTDKPTCEAALRFAKLVDAALKAAHEHHDPKVERARVPYQDRLEERNAVVKPLERAKERITGKRGAVTLWQAAEAERARREQERLQREADERAAADRRAREAEARAKEDEARRQREEAERARQAGEAAKAAALSQQAMAASEQAAEIHREAAQIEAPIITVTAEKPQVEGTQTGREKWDYRVMNLEEFICDSVAKRRVLKKLLAELRANGAEKATGAEVLGFIDFMYDQAPEVSFTLLTENPVTCRASAVANRDTVNWPGIKFYNAGSTAITGNSPRGRRKS